MTNDSRRWTVGEVAETSGLTVRTLHHWDEIGVLSPGMRGAGGRREYTEDDLGRLYVVLTLRRFGLDLESIRACLEARLDMAEVLTDQLAHLDRTMTALTDLRERVAQVVAAGAGQVDGADATELLHLMRAARSEEGAVLDRHLDPDQRERLARGAAALGPALAYILEIEWPQLYRRADELRRAGAAPDDARVQQIAGRMEELSARITAGDHDTGTAVRAAWHDDPAGMSGENAQNTDGWRDLAEYVDEARRLHRKEHS